MMLSEIPKKHIKFIKALKASKNARDREKCFIVEGLRSVEEAVKSNFTIVFAAVSNKFLNKGDGRSSNLITQLQCSQLLYMISEEQFNLLSDTVTPQGIMAVIRMKSFELKEFARENFFIIALDKIKDPGNLGTIIRTADAAGVNAVIAGKGCVDLYNPKVIRSTMGSIFHVPVISSDDIIETLMELKNKGGKIVSTHLGAKKYYYELDMTGPTVLVMGKEDAGVCDEINSISDEIVKIPMKGKAESLNVSIAHGIVLFEAVKQRMKTCPFACK
ncbi:MAG: 23S rRNA (guanosine(2251)-2'-O)-methyltransferase RlmB [Tepidanaerobacteraceae bacterium]|jgi:TrmH family RNA methyltransferase|nr:23S rRNA (guanosine(2251)-2'-O)-methyltransferase RlmB [Tepidanaerobacteraceae bacterium]